MREITKEHVFEWLREVKDPELPVLSLVDLGVISEIGIDNGVIRIELTPTFVGCPALEIMKEEIKALLLSKGCTDVAVDISFKRPWNSDMISTEGKKALRAFGISPPPKRTLWADLDILGSATCPRCNKTNTRLRTPFGSTLCRAIYYCDDCHEAFEQFKPL